jgi:hypothetical protein
MHSFIDLMLQCIAGFRVYGLSRYLAIRGQLLFWLCLTACAPVAVVWIYIVANEIVNLLQVCTALFGDISTTSAQPRSVDAGSHVQHLRRYLGLDGACMGQ